MKEGGIDALPRPAATVQPQSHTAHRELPAVLTGDLRHREDKRSKGVPPRPTECLNCGRKPLDSHYCPDCGQENLNYAVPIHFLLEDVFDEFIKWDGRLLRTLTLLLCFPGRFTSEYNAGRRVRYMSPFKLYLGVTGIFFLILFLPQTLKSFQQRLHDTGSTPPTAGKAATASTKSPANQKMSLSVGLDNVKKAKQDDKAGGEEQFSDISLFGESQLFTPKELRGNRKLLQGHLLDEYDTWHQDERNRHKVTGPKHVLVQQCLKCIDDPQHFAQELVESAAKAMFFLMPFYALFLAMLFRTPRKYYVEHLVFAINHHTFVFFLAGLITLGAEQKEMRVLWLLPLYYVYEFIALRTCYRQGKRLTLFKQLVLNHFYFFVVLIGLAVATFITVAFL